MSINNNITRKDLNWTTQQLVGLSKNLEQAYGLSFDNTKGSKSSDAWTTDRFINMSRYLSSAYGVDF